MRHRRRFRDLIDLDFAVANAAPGWISFMACEDNGMALGRNCKAGSTIETAFSRRRSPRSTSKS
jgi:hypothetical protein